MENPQQAWAEDEARFGLRVHHHRAWTARGVRPVWPQQIRFEWFYVFGAVQPASGRLYWQIRPGVRKQEVASYLAGLKRHAGPVPLVWDRSGGHRAKGVVPSQIKPLFLPAYSPDLNPVEQVWKYARKRCSNRVFADLQELRDAVTRLLRRLQAQPELVKQMTAFPWWIPTKGTSR